MLDGSHGHHTHALDTHQIKQKPAYKRPCAPLASFAVNHHHIFGVLLQPLGGVLAELVHDVQRRGLEQSRAAQNRWQHRMGDTVMAGELEPTLLE